MVPLWVCAIEEVGGLPKKSSVLWNGPNAKHELCWAWHRHVVIDKPRPKAERIHFCPIIDICEKWMGKDRAEETEQRRRMPLEHPSAYVRRDAEVHYLAGNSYNRAESTERNRSIAWWVCRYAVWLNLGFISHLPWACGFVGTPTLRYVGCSKSNVSYLFPWKEQLIQRAQ